MKTFSTIFLAATLFAISGSANAAAAADPVVGTWTLNLDKSTFPAGEAPKSQTRTYATSADGIMLKVSGVAADGSAVTQESTFKYDGKDYPMTGSKSYDALALKKVNGSTVKATMKLAGNVVGTTVRSVSAHGKVLTLTTDLRTAKGKKTHMVAVLEKQ